MPHRYAREDNDQDSGEDTEGQGYKMKREDEGEQKDTEGQSLRRGREDEETEGQSAHYGR